MGSEMCIRDRDVIECIWLEIVPVIVKGGKSKTRSCPSFFVAQLATQNNLFHSEEMDAVLADGEVTLVSVCDKVAVNSRESPVRKSCR